jgi:Bacterial regulatory proteins, luxR family.
MKCWLKSSQRYLKYPPCWRVRGLGKENSNSYLLIIK